VIDISTPGADDFGYPIEASDLIDAVPAGYVITDALGNLRDASPDIGALEYGASGDIVDPTVTITIPTSNPTYDNGNDDDINIGGTASDNVSVDRVEWSNANSGGSGSCNGTTAWSATIALVDGSNVITITAYDTSNNSATDQITVTYTAATQTSYNSIGCAFGANSGSDSP